MSQTPGWSSPGQPASGWGAAPPPLPGATPWGAPPPAPRPGVVPLRPLGVGEILDASIGYIRRNPRATLGLSTGVAVVTGAIQLALVTLVFSQAPSLTDSAVDTSGGNAGSVDFTLNGVSIAQSVFSIFLKLIATGFLTFVMSQAVLGRHVTIGEAWARVRPLFGRLVGLAALVAALFAALIAVCVLPGVLLLVAGADVAGVALIVLGGLIAVPLLIWLFVGIGLAPAAFVLERTTVTGALRRSWQLVKGSFWRILGITLLASVLSSIISSIISVPFGLIGGLGSLGFGASGDTALFVGILGITVGGIVGSIITLPFSAGVTSLLYIDRRMRREGLDLELARAAGVATPAPTPQSTMQPPTQPPMQPGAGVQQW